MDIAERIAPPCATDATRAEYRLLQLGGLGDDDSLRAHKIAMGLNAFSQLLGGNPALEAVNGEELGALVQLLADDAARVAERQQLDEARRSKRR